MKEFIKKHKILSTILSILIVLVLSFAGFVTYLTVTEFKPDEVQAAISSSNKNLAKLDSDTLKIMSFNMGYAGLGEESDFVLDGGKTAGASKLSVVKKNMDGISKILTNVEADIYMLQEIDLDSDRSFNINQIKTYEDVLTGYEWRYGQNFVSPFVPYPFEGPIKKIDSGIITYSNYEISEANRISLPNPFSWPIRIANLKRCLLETRLPLESSNKDVVIINFHLEAYDDGEGKLAQTKVLIDLLLDEYNKGNYVIAGGDFNQIFPEVETIVKETSKWVPGNLDPLPLSLDGWRYIYDDTTPTCRLLNEPYDKESSLTQFYVIDGFIVSPNIKVESIKTLNQDFKYSDHNPVLMEVKLK